VSKELLPGPKSSDLKARQLKDIRATQRIARRKENAHAHKTKIESEKDSSKAEIEGRCEESCENAKAACTSEKGSPREKAGGRSYRDIAPYYGRVRDRVLVTR